MYTSKLIAQKLLEIKALFLSPNDMFTWASGIKSPIYCDNRITLSYPETRRLIKKSFVELIKEKFPETSLIAGVATAGIPHAALIADEMNLPMIYVRSSAKDHGRTNQIEGKIPENSKIVVVEDLISTGSSSIEVIKALKNSITENHSSIQGLVAIFSYEFQKAQDNFARENLEFHTLSNYSTLIETALELGKITQEDVAILKSWRENMT